MPSSGSFLPQPRRAPLLLLAAAAAGGSLAAAPASLAEQPDRTTLGKTAGSAILSYSESAGVAGQSNKDIQKYDQLGDGLRSQTLYKPKFSDRDPDGLRAVQNGDVVTVDMIGYLTGWNGNVFFRSQDKSGYSEKPVTFKVGQGDAIPGLERGVIGMLKGEKRRLVVPPSLGYPRPCTEEQLGQPGAFPDPRDSAAGSGSPWELRNRLLNGVLNNARDDTLVLDVKVTRIS